MVFHRAIVKTARISSPSSMIVQASFHTGELGCRAVFEGANLWDTTVAVCFFPLSERGEQWLAEKWNRVGCGGISLLQEHGSPE
jgi:hypothetical protein